MANERRSFSTAAAPTTLSGGIDNAVTTITVQDGSTYVDGSLGKSVLTIDRGKSNEERILYTSRIGNTFSGLTRGYNGTAAQAHTAGAIVEHTSTQQDFDEANAHLSSAQHPFLNVANTWTAAQTFNAAVGGSGSIAMAGTDHYFGANAAGGAGTRVHLGSLGDAANGYVVAEGSAADVGLILKSQGVGTMAFKNGSDAVIGLFRASGQFCVGNIGTGGASTGALLGIANITNLPSTPAGGGFLYVQAGALKYVGSSGTITTVGPA